jgi:hypothetical protein
MVRVQVEVSASVGGFPVDFGGQGRLFPDNQNIKKGDRTVYVAVVKWMDSIKLLLWLRKSCNRSGPSGQTTNVSSTYRSHSDGFYCAESRANFSKCSMKVLPTMGIESFPYPSHLFVEKLVHLKICGSQANLQQLHDAFDVQDRRFRQCVIVVELVSDDF